MTWYLCKVLKPQKISLTFIIDAIAGGARNSCAEGAIINIKQLWPLIYPLIDMWDLGLFILYSIFNKEGCLVARARHWIRKHWSTTKLASWCQSLDISASITSGEHILTMKNLGRFVAIIQKANVNTWKKACWFLPVAASDSSEAHGHFWVEDFSTSVLQYWGFIRKQECHCHSPWVKGKYFLYLNSFFHDPENGFVVDMWKTELFWFSLKSYSL